MTAPTLQLPWPTGQQHRIYGGWTYGCPAGYPFYGTHDRLTNSDHYNADYYAVDFQLALGNDVSAVAPGTVIYRDNRDDGYGNKVVIDHGDGYYSVYAHLSDFAVSQWANVALGQLVGYAGGTGGVPVHLHMHMMLNSSAYKPEPMSNQPAGGLSFSHWGYSVENAGNCYSAPNDPSPYWTSTAPCITPTTPYPDGSLWRMDGDSAIYVMYGQTRYWIHSPTDFTNMGFHEEDVQCATAGSLVNINGVPYDKTLIREFGDTGIYVVDCTARFLVPDPGVLDIMVGNGYANWPWYDLPPGERDLRTGTVPGGGCRMQVYGDPALWLTCPDPSRKWHMSPYAWSIFAALDGNVRVLWPGALDSMTSIAQTLLRYCPDADDEFEWPIEPQVERSVGAVHGY